MWDDNLRWHRRQLMETAAKALERNGFSVALFDGRQEAVEFLLGEASGASTVGLGGSMSLAELKLRERFEEAGKTLLVHAKPGLTPEERLDVMRRQGSCDLFLTSTNALTLKGQLVNIDATGNRVCAMAFGPGKVVVVAGSNKIVSDLDAGLRRVREVACPPNARRLGFNTPCARTGVCSDCNSTDRICRITTIIERRPRVTDLKVCLINEELGY